MSRWTDSIYAIFASVYGAGPYGECTYQADCATTGGGQGTVGAPNTGFLTQVVDNPYMLVPTILIGAVLIATALLLLKKLARRHKGQ